MSTSIVLLVLAAVWCSYIAVWWKDSRRSAVGRGDRVGSFTTGMGTLGASANHLAGSGPVDLKPRSVGAASRRRQQILLGLGTAACVTLLCAIVFGPMMLLAHLVVDMAMISYGYAIVQRRNLAAEREIKVQMLYPEGVTPLHGPSRRTVNG